MKEKTFYKGAFALIISTFISKVIGAIYRVPLTNIIGSEGIGIYQTVFPVYLLLLEFSGISLPTAFSKIIAEKPKENRKIYAISVLKKGVKVFGLIGLFFTVILIVLSGLISSLQGNVSARFSYIVLAPSIFIVSVISCLRGYFQGQIKMNQTAISNVIEQTVKFTFGLILSYIFRKKVEIAVAGTTLAITLSELFALFYLIREYKKSKKGLIMLREEGEKVSAKKLFSVVFPITVIGLILPFSNFLESFYVVNILKRYLSNATSLFGLNNGVANSITGLPVALLTGISVTAIPLISSKQKEVGTEDTVLLFSVFTSFVFSVITYFLCGYAVRILFRNFTALETKTCINLIKITCPSVFFLSNLQTVNSILIGKGKLYSPLLGLVLGVITKLILSVVLLNNPKYNIYGLAIGQIACYFVGFLVNFFMVKKWRVKSLEGIRVKSGTT